MPDSRIVPDSNPRSAHVLRRFAARRLGEVLRTGGCPADRSFDHFLPGPLGVVSHQYWTPLIVAKRAAEWLEDLRIHTVVDIGSGAGKFCVAAALVGRCRFIGLEQSSSLVASARALAELFDVGDRVHFVEGALGDVPMPVADAYYLFNPFGEYCFGSSHDGDTRIEFSVERYAHDVAVVERMLRRAPVGTCVVTYNGFGGRIPEGYREIRVDRKLPRALRLCRKEAGQISGGKHEWRIGGGPAGGASRSQG